MILESTFIVGISAAFILGAIVGYICGRDER